MKRYRNSWLDGLPEDVAEYVQRQLDGACLTCPARQAPDMVDICQSCPIQGIYERASEREYRPTPCVCSDPWAPENKELLINSHIY